MAIPYHEFRTGLTFQYVRTELAAEQRAFERRGLGYMFVTRNTVLGRMHQYKLEAYDHYLAALASGNVSSEAA